MSAPETPAVTPGQAAYEAYQEGTFRMHSTASWDDLRERERAAWVAAGRAAVAARQPQPAPGPACEWCDHPKLKHEVGKGRCFGRHDDATACKCTSFTPAREQPEPQPAPGVTVEALAAALDGREIVVAAGNGWERRRARDSHALAGELLGVIDARLTGEQPQPAPGLAELIRSWRESIAELDAGPVDRASTVEVETLRTVIRQVERAAPAPGLATPAPELAAAMAESRRYREALEQVAKHHGSDMTTTHARTFTRIARRALEGK